MHHLLLSLTLELERVRLTSPECVSNLKVHLKNTYYLHISKVQFTGAHFPNASCRCLNSCSTFSVVLLLWRYLNNAYQERISRMHLCAAAHSCASFLWKREFDPWGAKAETNPLKIYKAMMTKMMMMVVCVGMWGWGAGTANPPQSAPSRGEGRLAMCILAALSSSLTRWLGIDYGKLGLLLLMISKSAVMKTPITQIVGEDHRWVVECWG